MKIVKESRFTIIQFKFMFNSQQQFLIAGCGIGNVDAAIARSIISIVFTTYTEWRWSHNISFATCEQIWWTNIKLTAKEQKTLKTIVFVSITKNEPTSAHHETNTKRVNLCHTQTHSYTHTHTQFHIESAEFRQTTTYERDRIKAVTNMHVSNIGLMCAASNIVPRTLCLFQITISFIVVSLGKLHWQINFFYDIHSHGTYSYHSCINKSKSIRNCSFWFYLIFWKTATFCISNAAANGIRRETTMNGF